MSHDPGAVPRAGGVYRSAAAVAMAVFRSQRWRFEVTGLEHVPDTGGAVIAANHLSFWDFFTVGRPVLYEVGRPVRILAKQSLFEVPLFGPVMRAAGHIPVQRASRGDRALEGAVAGLRAGELVMVMPEQTISRSFDLLPFKTGAARMATAAEVPLVPAASWGSQRFHTAGRRPRFAWRLPVGVAFGAPLHPGPGDDPDEVTAELRSRVADLLSGLQERYPDRADAAGAWWHPARLGGSAPEHHDEQSAAWRPEVSPPGGT